MEIKWASLFGEFSLEKNKLIFLGKQIEFQGQYQDAIGNFVCDKYFSGGSIEADITFDEIDDYSTCELMLYYDPGRRAFLTAGLGGHGANYSIRYFMGEWSVLSLAGPKINLKTGNSYHVKARIIGSNVILNVDGIDVLSARSPYSFPQSQVGLWCMSRGKISISNYTVHGEKPKIFVAMEFSSPYNEIYSEVIKRVSSEFSIETIRSDETFGSGIILADIVRQITESKAVIAEITSANLNVYYEVGYAHAIGKPTILIGEKSTKLPFDISPFRILFYENTIPGRTRFENGLRKHLEAILAPIKGR